MKIDIVELQLHKCYTADIELNSDKVFGVETAGPFFCSLIGLSNIEKVGIICMDNTYKVINYSCISMGNIQNVKVSLAQLFKVALLSNASNIIIAHNHPSGVLKITENDIRMTKKIGYLASFFDIKLVDSIVVNGIEAISIREKIGAEING